MEGDATSKFYRLTSPRSSSPKLYLQAAVRTETKLLKPLLQVVAVSLSLFVGWSRIADDKHFLTDVSARFVLGAIQFCMVCGESGAAFAVIKTNQYNLSTGQVCSCTLYPNLNSPILI